MARRKRSRTRWIVALAVVAAAAALIWVNREHLAERFAGVHGAATAVRSDRVDPANDGRRVRVSGRLDGAQAPRDVQLGISAPAAVLFRDVTIFQWHEHCDGGECRYDMAWSSAAVDSRRFRHPAGHENPPVPFASARFDAPGLHLGAFALDADLAAQLPSTPLPVSTDQLPPNLAATFQSAGGALYAGDDAAHPQVGAIRISYRIVALGDATVSGVQRGGRLAPR